MGNVLDWISGDEDPDEYGYDDPFYDGNNSSDNDGGSFPFSNIELLKSRKYDCILVFDEGSRNKEWNYQQYLTENNEIGLQYDYLNLLDADDIEDRKNRFPHNGVDWVVNGGDEMITIHDFNKNERKLVIKALKKLDIKCKSVHSLNRREKSMILNTSNTTNKDKKQIPKFRYYYVGISEERCRKWAHQIGYNLEIK